VFVDHFVDLANLEGAFLRDEPCSAKSRESVTRCRNVDMTTSKLCNQLERVRKRLQRNRKWREHRKDKAYDEIPYRHRQQLKDAAEFDSVCLSRKTEANTITPPRVLVRHPRAVAGLNDSDYQIRMAEWRQHVALNSKPTRRDAYNLPRKNGGYGILACR
jgi:hypothetical protein